MKNKLALVLVSSVVILTTALQAKAGALVNSVGYVVKGTVTLTKGKGALPNDLNSIYLGRDSAVSSKKEIPVTGTYVPGYNFVRVYEYNDTDNTQIDGEKYFFDLPVAPEAFSKLKKGTFKRSNTLITAYFTTDEALLNGGPDDDTNNSIFRIYKKDFMKKSTKPKNAIKKFKKKLHKIATNKFKTGVTNSVNGFGATMSVPKVVVKNINGSKGTINGKFDRDRSPAKGRFSLNFETSVTTNVNLDPQNQDPPFKLLTDEELQALIAALKEYFGEK